jgi:hypothetical protein
MASAISRAFILAFAQQLRCSLARPKIRGSFGVPLAPMVPPWSGFSPQFQSLGFSSPCRPAGYRFDLAPNHSNRCEMLPAFI